MSGPMTWSEFKVDLGQLHHAIGVIRREHDQIGDALNRISREFDQCREDWNTPAAVTFDNVKVWLTTASADLNALLSEMVTRMQTAYNNYEHTEEVNSRNLESHGKRLSYTVQGDGDGKRLPFAVQGDGDAKRLPFTVHGDGHGEEVGNSLRQYLFPVRLRAQYLQK
jgi:WXG100 family type VII secretion target